MVGSLVKKDLYRYEGTRSEKLMTQLRYLFFVPGFTYTFFMRKAQKSRWLRPFYVCFLKLTSYITGIQIPYQTRIGEGLYIGHWGAIIVNPSAVIGKNFNISAGVLIGNAQGRRAGAPIIGDNVKVGNNAIVVGGVHIGNDVLIAPGAFVNFDVPDNAIVVGNPGQIVRKETSPTAKYIVYPV